MNNSTLFGKGLLFTLLTCYAFHFASAQTPAYYYGIGTATNAIPLNAANNATHTQQIYTPSDFNLLPPSGLITKVYMRNTAAGASGTYTNFSISFLQNDLTAFPNSTFLTGFTTALSAASITITGNATAAQWFEIPLDVPFPYDNTKSLVYEIKYTGRTGGISTLNTNSTTGNKRLSIVAPPGPATGNLAVTLMDFGIDIVTTPCSGAPLPGAAAALPTVACANGLVRLSLTGHTPETGLSYTWQSSTDFAGPYTDISGALGNSTFEVTASATLYYRAAVSCNGGAPEYSDPVLVTVNPAFPGNTYTINNTLPTGGLNFNSFTEAINAISCGIAGKVVFEVSPDQTFFENPPEIGVSGTVTDSIIFRKSGTGANPVIVPINPGTVASSTTLGAHGDGVIVINGGDYISFDGIDINTNNFSSGADMFEYGYYLKKKSASDACKHVSIKNSVITLAKGIQSFGIHVSNNSGTTSVSVNDVGGASENIKISGNTISGSYGGILVRGQSTAAYYDQNIEIGVDSGNLIMDFGGGASTTAYGIYLISQNNAKIVNNTVTSVGSGHTTTLYGIYSGAATNANVDINNNTVGITGSGTTTSIYAIYNSTGSTGTSNTVRINNNTITGNTYSTATTGDLYLIDQTATAYNVEISGNTLNNNSMAATTSGIFYMIYQEGAVVNQSHIFNNTVKDNSKSSGTTGASYCIYNTGAGTSNNQIYNNTVENITAVNTSGSITGIHVLTGSTNAVFNNKISGLTNTASTTGAVYGITLGSGGLTNNVYNNIIVDLNAPTSTTAGTSTTDLIRGINITSTTANSTQNVSFNTILFNASGGTNFSTSGLFHTTSATATTSLLNLLNNIIVNHSTASGIGYTSAYRRSSANVLGNYGSLSNHNLFHVNAGSNHVIYFDGTNSDPDLSTFKARVAPRETVSISENPNFISSTAPFDLHIDASIPTQIESGAIPVAGITTDIDGQPRDPATPDIGADEFAGSAADLSGPAIIYTATPVKSICIETKTITATITDPNNVNVAPGTKPRLWFKKATESDMLAATNTSASDGWKYVEANDGASPFTFTFDYSLLTSPLVPGDSISYFVVAQDMASIPNVGVSIATFNTTPPTVALSAGAFPLSGNIHGFSVLQLPAISIKASNTNICTSGSTILDVDNTDLTGGEYQWQTSVHGANAWTDIPGATNISYTTPVLTDTTDFRLVVKCGGTPVTASPSNVIVFNVNNPQILSTTGTTICGAGVANLQATAGAGMPVNWYESPVSTTPLFTGNTFTTPVINTTTTYYASTTIENGGLSSVGLPEVTPSPTSGAGTTNFGLVFDALTNFTLQSVVIYPISSTAGTASTVTIDVVDGTGAVMHTATVNVVGYPTSSPVGQRVILNFNIAAGTNYKLRPGSRGTGISGLLFGPSPSGTFNFGYPFVIPGVVSINASTLSVPPANNPRLDLYYYFYDWQVVSDCEGPRVPVIATVNNNPGCAMPVTLLSFKGEKQNGYNKLTWSTASEINNSGFELLRSADGINFTDIVFIGSKANNGNSNTILNYGFDDRSPLRGYNYYRLKQVDKDGRSSYSNIVAIKGEKANAVQLLAVYPNPVKDVLNLKVEAPQGQRATIVVTDLLGQPIIQKQVQLQADETYIELPTAQLAQGVYFVRINCSNGCQSSVHKFIKD